MYCACSNHNLHDKHDLDELDEVFNGAGCSGKAKADTLTMTVQPAQG